MLTVAGASYVSRQGLAVMAAVGLPEFVADTPATMVRLAKEWTQRRPELAEIPINRYGDYRDLLHAAMSATDPKRVAKKLRKLWG